MITTFLHDGELNVPTSNSVINELLSEVRAKTGEDWQVIERTRQQKYVFQPWKKPKNISLYELYVYVGGVGPWQQINFYRDNSDSSINITNGAELIIAFFYGILCGLNCGDNHGQV